MKYIIMQVRFEDNVKQEEIDNITSKFYKDNEKEIVGMTTDTLKDKQAFIEFRQMYSEFQDK